MERALSALRDCGLLLSVPEKIPPRRSVALITADSRQASKGCVFVAIRGTRTDGLRHAAGAVQRGASVVVSDRPRPRRFSSRAAYVRVRDAAKALGVLTDEFYGRPTDALRVFGVTGTNGKTTTTYLIRQILNGLGRPAALLGTVNEEIPGRPAVPSVMTTPDAPKMNKFFRAALDAGCVAGVCEVSSHSLDQRRVWGIRFDTVIFTNLTQDHLDYHRTMEGYFEAKKKLFTEYEYRRAVINIDDAHGRKLAAELRRNGRAVVTYGVRAGADVRLRSCVSDLRGSRSRLDFFGRPVPLKIRLIGDYNLSNTAAALAACADSSNLTSVLRLLASASAPPGRMERVEAGQPFVVLVDYAHTPDALEKLLNASRRLNPRRLICVFGCGGDRDRTKRPKMGRIATQIADLTVVTSDNPRTEQPDAIIDEIRPGLRGREGARYRVEPDRALAIEMACRMARRGEIVVLAGKGHETVQIIGTTKHPFDDRQIARHALRTIGRKREC